jgi:hypothetical protein
VSKGSNWSTSSRRRGLWQTASSVPNGSSIPAELHRLDRLPTSRCPTHGEFWKYVHLFGVKAAWKFRSSIFSNFLHMYYVSILRSCGRLTMAPCLLPPLAMCDRPSLQQFGLRRHGYIPYVHSYEGFSKCATATSSNMNPFW